MARPLGRTALLEADPNPVAAELVRRRSGGVGNLADFKNPKLQAMASSCRRNSRRVEQEPAKPDSRATPSLSSHLILTCAFHLNHNQLKRRSKPTILTPL